MTMRVHAPQTVVMQQQPIAPSADIDFQEAWQVEHQRRLKAEAKVKELEGILTRLKSRIAVLEGRKSDKRSMEENALEDQLSAEDPIDAAICEYLELNPDFPVSIQKVANNHYVFGDRGPVYVTQRGEHIVVRVGGGFKSLQVFMDERALMVSRDAAAQAGPGPW